MKKVTLVTFISINYKNYINTYISGAYIRIYARVKKFFENVTKKMLPFGGHDMQKEARIEKWLVDQVKNLGGIADKYTSPSNPGVPDRIVILPGGKVYFVELKTEIGRLSNIQKWQRKRYSEMGCDVRVIKGMAEAKEFVKELEHEVQST